MPRRDGSPTRQELSAARRLEFFQARVDDASSDPVAILTAGFTYLASVVRRMQKANPKKAEEIVRDSTEFLLRQANAHDQDRLGGRR